MGAIIYIVNFDKRQYIDPACFGESVGPGGYMLGYHASAVALLTCAPGPLIDLGSPWPGAWFGDRVQVVYNERDYNPLGIETGTSENPDRELYPMIWQEFQEFSREALAMICNADEQTADELARRAKDDYVGFLLWNLGAVVANGWGPQLAKAIGRHFGTDWDEAYNRSKEMYDD
jgi:hypothetical protein